METDDGKRSNSGVVCSLRDSGNGKVLLVFDDVTNKEKTTKGNWNHEIVYTWKEYKAKEIENHELSEKELADIGYSLLARLSAQQKHPYSK